MSTEAINPERLRQLAAIAALEGLLASDVQVYDDPPSVIHAYLLKISK